MDNTNFKNNLEVSSTSGKSGSDSKGTKNGFDTFTITSSTALDQCHPDDPAQHSKYYYWKNFVGVSASILCLLTAYDSVFFIQSSLNSKGGLGSLALAVDYATQVTACLFLPALLMKKIGQKWTLVLAMIGVASFIGANMYATFGTLIPAAVLMAIGFSSMWATMNCVMCDLAKGYARLTNNDPKVVMSQFLGIFYMIIETGKIWGNLISSLALQPEGEGRGISSEQLAFCGAKYCNQRLAGNLPSCNHLNDSLQINGTNEKLTTSLLNHSGATQNQIITLCSISLGICAVGIVCVLALVDSPKSTNDTSKLLSHVLSTIKMLSNKNLLLLIVMTICDGLVQSFHASDFTKSFLTCSLGIQEVGFVTMSYGAVVVLASISMGYVERFVGRQFLLLFAVAVNITDLLIMLFWMPDPNRIVIFHLISAFWAISTGIWLTTLVGLYAEVFANQHEEAFSNHRLFECIGFVIGFVWSPQLCMKDKIYGTMALITLGVFGYIALELKLWHESKYLKTSPVEG